MQHNYILESHRWSISQRGALHSIYSHIRFRGNFPHSSDSLAPEYSHTYILILTVLVVTIDAQWEGMGDVGSARYELALLPPCPTIRVLSYSN